MLSRMRNLVLWRAWSQWQGRTQERRIVREKVAAVVRIWGDR